METTKFYHYNLCFKECEDDVAWNDGDDGRSCLDYEKNKWCKNGFPTISGKSKIGSLFNNPELHCCSCGKLGRGKLF